MFQHSNFVSRPAGCCQDVLEGCGLLSCCELVGCLACAMACDRLRLRIPTVSELFSLALQVSVVVAHAVASTSSTRNRQVAKVFAGRR